MPRLTIHLLIASLLCLALSGCQKQEVQPTVAPAASPTAAVSPTAIPAPTVAAAPARELVVPPEDKIEPMRLEQARLPGGGELKTEPAPVTATTTARKTP